MAKLTTITYDLTGGSATIAIQKATNPLSGVSAVSYQLQGDGAVDGTVTVKLQETNVHASGQEDIVGASAVANVSTNEYVGMFDAGGAFLNFDVALGTATAGIITITLNYQQWK